MVDMSGLSAEQSLKNVLTVCGHFGIVLGMETYVKLYQRLLDSSVWRLSSDIRIVWITILALKDQDGCVHGGEGWLADRARVDDEVCRKALKIFLAPDKRSRTVTNDGRKIEAIEGGWRVLNHWLYRDGMEEQQEKWRRQKAAQRERAAREKREARERMRETMNDAREAELKSKAEPAAGANGEPANW